MSDSIVVASPKLIDLQPSPIVPGWIVAGSPVAECEVLCTSQDRTSFMVVWECSAGVFNWHYTRDETVFVVSGEVFITCENGEERRIGSGDTAFFPAGSSCTWRVTERIRKVAVLRDSLPPLLAFGLRAWNKLLRLLRPQTESMI